MNNEYRADNAICKKSAQSELTSLSLFDSSRHMLCFAQSCDAMRCTNHFDAKKSIDLAIVKHCKKGNRADQHVTYM